MGSDACPIEPGSEVVDFCMQYRIPKIEGLEDCKNLKVSKNILLIYLDFRNLAFVRIW